MLIAFLIYKLSVYVLPSGLRRHTLLNCSYIYIYIFFILFFLFIFFFLCCGHYFHVVLYVFPFFQCGDYGHLSSTCVKSAPDSSKSSSRRD